MPILPRSRDNPPARPLAFFAAAVIICGLALLLHGCADGQSPSAGPVSIADYQVLKGRWLRPDGGYVLEVRDVAADGSVTAAYLNPRPIHVSKAEASRVNSETRLFIELQDVGYPGSTYALVHDPGRDVLEGIYYQAQMQQSFEVVFVRMK